MTARDQAARISRNTQIERQLEDLELRRGALVYPIKGFMQRVDEGATVIMRHDPGQPAPREGDRIVHPQLGISTLVETISGIDMAYFTLACLTPTPWVPASKPPAPPFDVRVMRTTRNALIRATPRVPNRVYRCRYRQGTDGYWRSTIIDNRPVFVFTGIAEGTYVVGLTQIGDNGEHSHEALSAAVNIGT